MKCLDDLVTLNNSICHNCNYPATYDDISGSRELPSVQPVLDYAALARQLKMGYFQGKIIGDDSFSEENK